MGRKTGREVPTIGELWPQRPFRKREQGSRVAAAAGAQARRVRVASPNDTVRVTFVTPTPTCYPLPSHPLAVFGPLNPRSHGRSSGLPSTLDSLRFGWIDCLVPAQHWAHALATPMSPQPRDGNFSPCLHLRPQILLLPSSLPLRKASRLLRYLQAIIPPRRPGNGPRHSTPAPIPG